MRTPRRLSHGVSAFLCVVVFSALALACGSSKRLLHRNATDQYPACNSVWGTGNPSLDIIHFDDKRGYAQILCRKRTYLVCERDLPGKPAGNWTCMGPYSHRPKPKSD